MSDVEELFDAERDLRVAAIRYAESKTDENRKGLRQAALEYAVCAQDVESALTKAVSP